VKFCQFVARLYTCSLILVSLSKYLRKWHEFFEKYLPFLPFRVLSFNKSDCLDFIARDEWPQFTQPQSTGLSGLGAMLES